MAIKSANVIARVYPDIKKAAEEIISDLGLNASAVINALYRQIIYNKGIPFEMKKEPINIDDMSDEELEKLLVQRIKNFEKMVELNQRTKFLKKYLIYLVLTESKNNIRIYI